jgi:hypothetical protein
MASLPQILRSYPDSPFVDSTFILLTLSFSYMKALNNTLTGVKAYGIALEANG